MVIGENISQYRIIEKLGAGGMGEVYLAEDTSLHRKVALKFLPEHLYENDLARMRFLREAESAAALDHPYICHINEVSQTETGQDFIVMEYVEGQTLQDKLDERPFTFEEAVKVGKEVADALEIAHQRGIVHRDLKPANIMLTRQGHAKVMDFGLAKRVSTEDGTEQDLTGLTREDPTLGTPAYMSPEQVRAQPVDHRSDIFSFGVIFYEMLTGLHPFRRAQAMETMGAILHEGSVPLAERLEITSPLLQETIDQLLAKDPDGRFQTIVEVSDRLTQLSTGQKKLGLVSFLRRRPKMSLALALGAIAAIVLVGWWVFRDRPGDAGGPVVSSIPIVLPLKNLSADPEQEYFVDEMTDALITDLSKIGALKVIARKSAMRYRDTDKPLSEIAQELNVEAVIVGSVQREADQVRITAQLIEAATGKNLWADRYERNLTSVLALQGEVAQAVAREIQVTLSPQEETLLTRTRQVNPEAYENYLKGQFYNAKLTRADLETALQYFRLSLQKDPNYALAYSGTALAWASLQQMGLVPRSEAGHKARDAALKAVELDDTLAEGHRALAGVKAWTDWDWEGAEESFRRAIELNPKHGDARSQYSHVLMIMQRPEEAMAQITRALELDPLNSIIQAFYAVVLNSRGLHDEAIEVCLNTLRTDPHHLLALNALRNAYHAKEMYEEQLEIQKTNLTARGRLGAVEALERGYLEGGYEGANRRLEEWQTTHFPSGPVTRTLLLVGKYDQALDKMERLIENRNPTMAYIGVHTIYRPLHNEPRYQDLLRRMNFPEDVIERILDENR